MRSYLPLLFFIFSLHAYASEEIPDLEIEEVQEGVFLHKSFSRVDEYGLVSSNGLVVVDDGKAFIVDTPWSVRDTEKLVDWIHEQGYELLGSLSTHSHDDRTSGIPWLNEHSIPTYASESTNEILRAAKKEPAKFSFTEERFSLANGRVEAFYPGAGHTADNLVVWLPESRILYGGCFVRGLGAKGLGYVGEARVAEWPASVERVLHEYPEAVIVIPGHGKRGDIELLHHTRTLAESASN